ncbi:MAG: hypothetical protein SV186_02895 [Candidatus Nanohaloarchaea archaeon]|nr:hypothetical protein [Candidatus Nanohaloarchaea archaeon]
MLPDERQVVEAALVDEHSLESAVYLEDGGTIAVYDEDGEELASTSYDVETMTSFREALQGDYDADEAVERLDGEDLYVEVDAPADSAAVEEHELAAYMEADGIREEISQDVMEHEYDTAMCHQCHNELDVMEADPEREGLKVRMYSCDDCGYHDHEFVEEEITEDGPVVVSTTITDEDDLRRFVDVREDAAYKLVDLDELEEVQDRFRVQAGLERESDLDRRVQADDGTEVTVYGIDGKHRTELASREFEEQAAVTPREMLVDELQDDPDAFDEVRDYVEDMETGTYAMVEVDGIQDTAVAVDTQGLDEVERQEEEDLATIYEKPNSRPTQVPVEGLLAQLTDRHTMLRDGTRQKVEEHREDPNFELRIHDRSGGSDVEHDEEDEYVKVVEEHDVRLGSLGDGAPQ